MADQFHINPETGQVGKCFAKLGPCPFGEATDHFSSAEEGRAAYEASQREELFSATVRKKPPAYGRVQVSAERLQELQQEGFSFSPEGTVTYAGTSWGTDITVTSGPDGPQLSMPSYLNHRMTLEEPTLGTRRLYYETWQGTLTTGEAQGYADELEQSRYVAREAVAAAERAEAVRHEVFGLAEGETPVYIEPLREFEPVLPPHQGFELQYDGRGRVVEELRDETYAQRISCTVLVDDDPREGLYVRIKPDYRGPLQDEELQEYIYSLRRGVLTSRDVEEVHMTRR